MTKPATFILTVAALALGTLSAPAVQEDFESWEPLQSEFPSTGGGGIVIRGYDPVIAGDRCVTDFSAHTPDGQVFHNTVEFETVQVQGGTLCTNGKWRSKDGSAAGTTPFWVFIKDGIRRRAP